MVFHPRLLNDKSWAEVSKINISDNMNRSLPRSPTSISPVSSRRGSLRFSQLEKDSIPPKSSPPPPRLTRKRNASINTDAANDPRIETLALNSAGINGPQTATREQVCLCQPDPKIPRPRNAFILYRQHYQAQVVAQNPGLANPEISKIIGEQWREQPIEVKNDWKRLAEEEKQRHQRQYPDYRYQPRRAGKQGGRPVSSSSAEDPVRCPKCHGRYISTPGTPLTPFTPPFGPRNERLLPPFTPVPSSRPIDVSSHGHFMPVTMSSPRTTPGSQRTDHRQFPQQNSGYLQLGSLREREDEIRIMQSPRSKRYRPNETPNGYPSPSWSGTPQRLSRPPLSAIGYEDRHGPLPGPNTFIHHHQPQGMMEPPPRPSPLFNTPQYSSHSSHFDESLRLPPLQTQQLALASNPPSAALEIHQQPRGDPQARSVEAMVMTIPFINKIKVLAKISSSLPPAGPCSPTQDVRGAVVAVEGADSSTVAEVGKYLEDYLSKEPDCAVRTWSSTPMGNSPEADISGMATPSPKHIPKNPFVSYLDEIQAWHLRATEMTRFITTAPISLPPDAMSTPPTTLSDHHTILGTPTAAKVRKMPIALLPTGYSLSISDTFASHIPINDAYAPVDHWQWMATLWRGIVGPDLTVYVRLVGPSAEDRDAVAKYGAVEVRADCAGIVVRLERGEVDERVGRRLGFEVLEAVRGVSGSHGGTPFGRL